MVNEKAGPRDGPPGPAQSRCFRTPLWCSPSLFPRAPPAVFPRIPRSPFTARTSPDVLAVPPGSPPCPPNPQATSSPKAFSSSRPKLRTSSSRSRRSDRQMLDFTVPTLMLRMSAISGSVRPS